jgi:hypothetical protein
MLERVHRIIRHETSPPKAVLELLTNTYIGTNGTMYQLQDTARKIHQLNKPHFFYLERNGKAVGNMTICERTVVVNHQEIDSFYIRYFAFDTVFQGSTQKGHANSAFHHYFKAFFAGSNLNPTIPSTGKSVFWAFIDPENLRSFHMNERFGFQTIRQFRTWAFSRIHPKNKSIERLKKEDHQKVLRLISDFYKGFNFFSTVHLFENDDFYILRDKGEIIAGIQANPVSWKIKSLPGFSGKMLLKTAPYIPGIRKLISPNNHRFLATEGLFWKAGYQDRVSDLLEGVLSLTDHHSLLIWEDTQLERISALNVKWGFIQRMKTDNPVNVVARFNGYDQKEVDAVKAKPVYLSGFDMT